MRMFNTERLLQFNTEISATISLLRDGLQNKNLRITEPQNDHCTTHVPGIRT